MLEKKQPQWGIDRAYNMSVDNSNRTKKLLRCIYDIEAGKYSKEDGLLKAEELKVVPSVKTYLKSTQTGLNSYGLLKSVCELTEVSKAFITDKISFSELMILQLYKKEYKHPQNTSHNIIRPFVLFLGILLNLYEKNKAICWLDYYDYAKYLTEIKTYDEVDEVINHIIIDKENKDLNRNLEYSVYDFDIWTSAFLGTGLIKLLNDEKSTKKQKFTIVEDEIPFVRFLWETKDKAQVIEEYNKKTGTVVEQQRRKELFGSMSNGIFEVMPRLEFKEVKCMQNIETDVDEFLYATLVEGKSARRIEEEVLGTDHLKGWFTQAVLETFGLNQNTVKGIFSPFKNHMHLLSLNPNYDAATKEIIRMFLERDDIEMETYSYLDERVSGGFNKIYYGIPGCGKSYKISAMLDYKEGFQEDARELGITQSVPKENIFRTTFYLDYSNSDFVGQLMPKTERGKVYYKPVFGPFTKALKRACETKEMVYLVIEEINRGNAAAIFGDIFQLLDRYKDEKDGHKKGDSMYPITNDFIEDYLGIEKGQIIIPSNLTIFATMNTSDQNVFPLDTAFKRRWDRENVVTSWDNVSIKDLCIPYTDFTWQHFATSINDLMTSEEANGTISEDKKIGPYFIDDSILVSKECRHEDSAENKAKLRGFANNVVDYLFNDVTKFDHGVLFSEKNSYDVVYKNLNALRESSRLEERAIKFAELFANKITANINDTDQFVGEANDEENNNSSNREG